MLVWDNQQAINWLVGMIDGEASFCRRETGYRAISIHNNDLDLIVACEKVLAANQISFETYTTGGGKLKISYVVQITGQSCLELFNLAEFVIQCRRQEFQKILSASETVRELSIDLGWLVGIYEAEGSMILSMNHRNSITPKIELDNTNQLIIKKIVKNLHALGCAWYVKDYDLGKKPFTKITIQGLGRCQRFLDKLNGFWQSSRNTKRAKIISNFCSNRLPKCVNEPYESALFDLVNQMRQLNGK